MIARLSVCLLVAVVAALPVRVAHAQTPLLDEVRTVSGGAVPIEKSFAITQAGAYQLTLTDLKLPAALTSAKLAVTNGTTVLGTGGTTPSNASAVINFDAPADTIVVRIVGKPATAAGSGAVGVKVTRVSDSAVIQEFVQTIGAPPPEVPDNQAMLSDSITPAVSGTYEVALSDIELPQALIDLELGVTQDGGPQVVVLMTPGTATFSAQAGVKYNILALAEADASVTAGLFSVRMREVGSGNVLFKRTVPVGRVEQLSTVNVSAGPHVLSLTDLQFPAPLSQMAAALTLDGVLAARAIATGDTSFTAAVGAHDLFAVAKATGTNPGTYAVEVRPTGGTAEFSAARTVGGAPGATPAYTFVADIPAAGTYRVRLADFAFPAGLTAAQLAVAQSGNLLGTLAAPATLDVNAAMGRLFIAVLAQPANASGGLLGVDVTAANGGTVLFETTQGIGNLFESRKVTVTGTATYRVRLGDVGFPASFKELGAVVTRGGSRLGTVLMGSQSAGSAPTESHFDFDATSGNYFVTFLSTPDAAENAGTYSLRVADKPAAPTVTLTASASQVTTGGTVELTWTSANATACLASDGWSGNRATAGTERSTALTAATNFKLECTGEGGSTNKTVNVSTVAQSSGGRSGGGGGVDWLTLLVLGVCLVVSGAARAVSERRLLSAATRVV